MNQILWNKIEFSKIWPRGRKSSNNKYDKGVIDFMTQNQQTAIL